MNLDQFYTKDYVVDICLKVFYETVEEPYRKVIIEPSAGTGSFFSKIPNCIGMDLDPKCPGIITKDFLISEREDFGIQSVDNSQISIIGNPPFGKYCSGAIRFFNKCSSFSDHICFVFPRSFRKESIQKRLSDDFHLIQDIDLPENSFIHKGLEHNVPCCFQIWKKTGTKRVIESLRHCSVFTFSTKEDCDFAVRRVGGKSGKAFLDYKTCSESSNYFIKLVDKKDGEKIIKIINDMDFSSEVNSTVGVRSLSKSELVNKILKQMEG